MTPPSSSLTQLFEAASKDLKNLGEKVSVMQARLEFVGEKVKETTVHIDKLRDALAQSVDLNRRLNRAEAEIEKLKGHIAKGVWIVVGSVLAAVVSLVVKVGS